jgi:hypothetical protein
MACAAELLENTELFSDLANEFSCAKSGTLPPNSGTAYS